MNYRLLIPAILICMFSCKSQYDKLSDQQLIEGYVSGLNSAEFSEVDRYVSDSIVSKEFDFLLSDNIEAYSILFLWDSVFEPHYTIVEMKETELGVQMTLSKECKRIRFLNDSPILSKVNVSISNNEITEIQIYEHQNLDFSIWDARRDTLVSWIDSNHPELSGFVYDQTIEGGQDYLTAIELCERIPRSSTSGLASTIKVNNQSMIPRSLLRGESIVSKQTLTILMSHT